jgi:hypothetical protein
MLIKWHRLRPTIAIAAGELLGNFPMDQTLSLNFTMKYQPRLTATIRLDGAYGTKDRKSEGGRVINYDEAAKVMQLLR